MLRYASAIALISFAYCCFGKDNGLFVSYDAVDWQLTLSTSVGIEHSVVGHLAGIKKNPNFRNEVELYSGCDRHRIVLGQIENAPGYDKKSKKTGKTTVSLILGKGEYDLKYLGMGQGSQAFDLPSHIWKSLKSAKWAKLSYVGQDEAPVEIRLDMTHLPLLMETVDTACN